MKVPNLVMRCMRLLLFVEMVVVTVLEAAADALQARITVGTHLRPVHHPAVLQLRLPAWTEI